MEVAVRKKMVSAADVARELGVAGSTIRQYVREGKIPVALRTPGGHARFVLDEVRGALRAPQSDLDFENQPIPARSFAPVGADGDGDVIVNLSGQPFEISEDWDIALGIAAAGISTGDADSSSVDPVVGVRGSGRFAVEHTLVPA